MKGYDRRRTWRCAALLLGAVIVGCTTDEPPEPPSEEALPVEEAADTTSETSRPDRATAAGVPESAEERFPHGPHRSIVCETCHERVAGHGTHREVACTECHAVPERFAELRVLADRECLACHHDQRWGYSCSRCHRSGEVAGSLAVRLVLEVSGWDAPRERERNFDHRWHTDVDCRQCHAESIRHEVTAECSGCHEDHHRPELTCRRCHVAGSEEVHAERAHAGCGGAGCHVDPVVASLPPARGVCMACHDGLEDHKPGRDCAECHALPPEWRRRSGGSATGGMP